MKTIWNTKKFELDLGEKTYVMGILNVTPDSFSDGGIWMNPQKAIKHALDMQSQGADIIDIGGQSTRPGHVPVTEEEEAERVLPIIRELSKVLLVPISVDTYYPKVARAAVDEGASIVNDVSGYISPEMAKVIASSGAGWIIMHTGVDFSTNTSNVGELMKDLMEQKEMIASQEYPEGIAKAVHGFFEKSYFAAAVLGVQPEQICFDTGIGFGKSYEQNLELLRDTHIARLNTRPILIGVSRKRFIGEAAREQDVHNRLSGTIAANVTAISCGADIIRVHDVAENVQAARVADAIYRR